MYAWIVYKLLYMFVYDCTSVRIYVCMYVTMWMLITYKGPKAVPSPSIKGIPESIRFDLNCVTDECIY